MNWGDMLVESKAFKIIIKGAFWGTIAIGLLIIFMICNFLFKINILDYRFDDGELHPPIETSINNDQLNLTNGYRELKIRAILRVAFSCCTNESG